MAIATQYKAHSLIRHMQRGWNFFRAERNEFLDILPASQRMGGENWYLGTADAVTQNIDIVDSYNIDYIIILAGDHIYKMDYEIMLRQHVETKADVTVGCLTVPRADASAFGVMATNKAGQITSFQEKPADPPSTPEDPNVSLASMGIYVFNWSFLRELLLKDRDDPNSSHDFGSDLIPDIVKNGKAMAHRFDESCVRADGAPSYWKDVGTVDAFWQANIDLTDFTPELNLWDRNWPIWTYAESVPPAKFIHDERGSAGAGRIIHGVWGVCDFGNRSSQFAAFYAGSYQFLGSFGSCGGIALCDSGAECQIAACCDRRRGDNSGKSYCWGGPSRRCQAFPRERKGNNADHAAHGRRVDRNPMTKVLSVTSECAPLVKTGGLADVAGALPVALAPEGIEMRTLLPGYPAVMSAP